MTNTESPPILYKHPPITEAVIAINFKSPIKLTDINSVNKRFHTNYPQHLLLSNVTVGLHIDQAKQTATTNTNNKVDGHRHSTADMTQLLVLWPNSFTISQLAPYPGWEQFFDRFVRDWTILKRTIGFKSIDRIGVRYINRVDIPVTAPIINHEDFLNVYPKLPDILNPINAYALQAACELKDINCLLTLNSADVPSPLLDRVSFLLDLDISKVVDLPQSDNDIYNLLNKIRVKKNVIFESCISDQARNIFNEVIN